MMPLARTAGHGLLEGEVLLAAEQEKIAHRRIIVGAAEHGVGGDAHATCHGDRVRRVPACRPHAAHEVGLITDEADIDRIAGVPVPGLGNAIDPSKKWVAAKIERPQFRYDQIGAHGPEKRDQQQCFGFRQMQGCYPAFQGSGWMPSSSMRASVHCLSGIIANDPVETVYFNTASDGSGRLLDGSKRYTARFAPQLRALITPL